MYTGVEMKTEFGYSVYHLVFLLRSIVLLFKLEETSKTCQQLMERQGAFNEARNYLRTTGPTTP